MRMYTLADKPISQVKWSLAKQQKYLLVVAKYFYKIFSRRSFPALSTSALAKLLVLTWCKQVRLLATNSKGEVCDIKSKSKELFYSSVPNLRRGWWRSAELPGVHRDDEGPHPPRAEELQQAGGLGGVQAVHQAGDEGGLVIRIRIRHQSILSVVIHSSQNIPVRILIRISLNCYLIFRYISFWSEPQLNCLIRFIIENIRVTDHTIGRHCSYSERVKFF